MRAALSIIFRPLVLSVPLVLFVLLIAAPRSAPAQDSEVPSRYIDDTFRFDARGDAQIEITFQYGARQWEQWREQYGDHPNLLLRDLRYQLASSDIQNFTLDADRHPAPGRRPVRRLRPCPVQRRRRLRRRCPQGDETRQRQRLGLVLHQQ